MRNSNPFKWTLTYIYAHWPMYLLGFGGIIAALTIMGISAIQGWLAFVPLAFALFLIITYFTTASIWSAHRQYGKAGLIPHQVLFDMGQVAETEDFAYVHLGVRHRAVDLGRRLTTGRAIVIDIYSPQLTPHRSLVRWRSRMVAPTADPRFEWYAGAMNLLPLPDRSVPVVVLCQVLSEVWQDGDRQKILREIYRVMSANGRLLIAERTRTTTNSLLLGPAVLNLQPAEYWKMLLADAGFKVRNERDLEGILHCFRAYKPSPTEARQLALEFDV